MVAHLGLTALGLGQTMFGFAGDANDSISNAYPLKARRSWRAFFAPPNYIRPLQAPTPTGQKDWS